jgi:hypothetical protein
MHLWCRNLWRPAQVEELAAQGCVCNRMWRIFDGCSTENVNSRCVARLSDRIGRLSDWIDLVMPRNESNSWPQSCAWRTNWTSIRVACPTWRLSGAFHSIRETVLANAFVRQLDRITRMHIANERFYMSSRFTQFVELASQWSVLHTCKLVTGCNSQTDRRQHLSGLASARPQSSDGLWWKLSIIS